MNLGDDLAVEIRSGTEAEILVCRAAEAVCATVDATAIAINGIIEADVRTVVMSNDGACSRLFKDFELSFGRLTKPLDRVRQPRVGRIFDVAHFCNLVPAVQQEYQIFLFLARPSRVFSFLFSG